MNELDYNKFDWEYMPVGDGLGTVTGTPKEGRIALLEAVEHSLAIYRDLKEKKLPYDYSEDGPPPIITDHERNQAGGHNLLIKNISPEQWKELSGNEPYKQSDPSIQRQAG